MCFINSFLALTLPRSIIPLHFCRTRNNRVIFLFFAFLFSIVSLKAQENNVIPEYKDYKDPKQFENFQKRRTFISQWQINQLKKGAIVVRLQTNQKLIEALTKAGNEKLATQKAAEQFAINKNTMFAYMEHLDFCKVYFIYSNSSDTLLKGARKGIFLDTNLAVNPNIEMTESFYLLAERDYAYNSSIGFVPEDSARFVTEQGNPIKEMAIILKNKYGHQLKKPFPYEVQGIISSFDVVLVGVTIIGAAFGIAAAPLIGIGSAAIIYTVDRTLLKDLKNNGKKSKVKVNDNENVASVKIKKEFTYEQISIAVKKLNRHLNEYYRTVPHFDTSSADKKIIPFLY